MRPALLHSLMVTLRVTFMALALSIVIGTAIAFLFVQSPIIERSFFPYAVILQVTPIVAIAPLIIILVKNTQGRADHLRDHHRDFPDHLEYHGGLAQHRCRTSGLVRHQPGVAAGRSWSISGFRARCRIFFAGLRISSGLALIGAVVAEFVAGTGGRNTGLAYEILQSGYQLDIPRMFAALFLITLAGIALFLGGDRRCQSSRSARGTTA